jgi:hypothetical protein
LRFFGALIFAGLGIRFRVTITKVKESPILIASAVRWLRKGSAKEVKMFIPRISSTR